MLTKKQKEVLNFIKSFIEENDYSPSFEEIKEHFSLSSKSTAYQHVESLRNKGFLKKTNYQARSIRPNKDKKKNIKPIPLSGMIAAGKPIEAIEEKGTIEVAESQLSKSGKHFALKVKGNSMINEGIMNGDIVIVRKQSKVENGEKGVALINNEATLKKIYKEKNRYRLQPANPNIKPIYTKNCKIKGKVIKVIRNFK